MNTESNMKNNVSQPFTILPIIQKGKQSVKYPWEKPLDFEEILLNAYKKNNCSENKPNKFHSKEPLKFEEILLNAYIRNNCSENKPRKYPWEKSLEFKEPLLKASDKNFEQQKKKYPWEKNQESEKSQFDFPDQKNNCINQQNANYHHQEMIYPVNKTYEHRLKRYPWEKDHEYEQRLLKASNQNDHFENQQNSPQEIDTNLIKDKNNKIQDENQICTCIEKDKQETFPYDEAKNNFYNRILKFCHAVSKKYQYNEVLAYKAAGVLVDMYARIPNSQNTVLDDDIHEAAQQACLCLFGCLAEVYVRYRLY